MEKKENKLRLYHGNPNPEFKPHYGGGKEYHDYGKGLYCVDDPEFAKEWACQYADLDTSYIFAYDLDLDGLPPILDLNMYPPVYWISILANHRFEKNEPIRRRTQRERLVNLFPVDCEKHEVIKGWRADDSYFAYLRNFLRGDYAYEAIIQAMEFGNLGQQYVIKGKRAYNNCAQIERIIITGSEYVEYFNKYKKRDDLARDGLRSLEDVPGMYIEDVIVEGERGKWKVVM
jgi:hypothetical protein